MKHISTLSCLLLLSVQAFAQMINFNLPLGVKNHDVATFALDSGKFFVVQLEHKAIYSSEGANVGNTQAYIRLYNPLMQLVKESVCRVPYMARVQDCLRNKAGYAMLFHSIHTDQVTLATINFAGAIHRTTRFDVAVSRYAQDAITVFTDPDDTAFYLFLVVKKNLRTLTKLDSDQTVLWKRELDAAQYRSLAPHTIRFGSGGLSFDHQQKETTAHTVLDKATGSTLSYYALPVAAKPAKGEKLKHPTHLLRTDSLLTEFGYYFQGKESPRTHEGLYLSVLNARREVLFEKFHPVGTLSAAASGAGLKGSLDKLVPNRLVSTDDGYLLVAETVDKVASGAFAGAVASGVALRLIGIPGMVNPQITSFHMQDVVVAKFDKMGALVRLQTVPKYVSHKNVPSQYLTELNGDLFRTHRIFDADEFMADPQGGGHLILLKENPYQSQPFRMAYARLDAQGDVQVKHKLLAGLVGDKTKPKTVDWFLLSTGDVVFWYMEKDVIHMGKVKPDEFQ